MSNIVENNNSIVNFIQVWPETIYTEVIPETPPTLTEAIHTTGSNKDGTPYNLYTFKKVTANKNYPYLMYISHFQLTKEFRQKNIWKIEIAEDEESIRRIIFPGKTTTRKYAPTFSSEGQEIPYTNLNPRFDLRDCRINVEMDLDELYFSGWLYVGESLADFIDKNELPFSDQLWLLQNNEGNKARLEVTQEKVYVLPPDEMESLPEGKDTIVTTNILNWIMNEILDLDGGRYW